MTSPDIPSLRPFVRVLLRSERDLPHVSIRPPTRLERRHKMCDRHHGLHERDVRHMPISDVLELGDFGLRRMQPPLRDVLRRWSGRLP